MKEAQWGLNCLKGQHQLMIPVEKGVNRFHSIYYSFTISTPSYYINIGSNR